MNTALKKIVYPLGLAIVAAFSFWAGQRSTPQAPNDGMESEAREAAIAASSLLEQSAYENGSGEVSKSESKSMDLDSALSFRDSNALNYHLGLFLEGMSADEAEGVLARLQELPSNPQKSQLLRQLFQRWGELDGERALEAAKHFDGRDRMGYISSVAGGWAKSDRDAAWAAVMVASNRGAISAIDLGPILTEIACQDLKYASELLFDSGINSISGGRLNALLTVASETGQYDVVLQSIVDSESLKNKARSIETLFERWGQYEFEEPLMALDALANSDYAEKSMLGFMKGWASVDGKGAFEYVLGNNDNELLSKTIGPVAQILARSSTAEEIVTLFEGIEDSTKRGAIASSIIFQLASANPVVAIEWANEITDEKIRSSSISRVMSTWTRSDYEGAREAYYSENFDSESRSRSIRNFMYAQRERDDSASSISEMIEAIEDPVARNQALSRFGAYSKLIERTRPGYRKQLQEAVIASEEFSEAEKESFIRNMEMNPSDGTDGMRMSIGSPPPPSSSR